MVYDRILKTFVLSASLAIFGCSASNTSEPDSDTHRSEREDDSSNSKGSSDSKYSSSRANGSSGSNSESGSNNNESGNDDYSDESSSSNSSSSEPRPRISTDKYLNPNIQYGSMTDSRDGQVYKTVKIGIQNWMAQNLNYINPKDTTIRDSRFECGQMYTWMGANYGAVADCNENDAMNPQGICPDGWHVPTPSDWGMLFNYAKDHGVTDFAKAFRSKVEGSWPDDTGTDDFGFAIVFGGYGSYNGYTYVTTNNFGQHQTGLWTSEHGGFFGSDYAQAVDIEPSGMGLTWYFDNIGNFLRCIENYDIDSLAQPTPDAGSEYDSKANTLKDLRDNEVYRTTKIGDQVWMAENLRYYSKGGFADDGVHSMCRTKDSCFVGRYYTWAAAMDMAYSLYKYKNKKETHHRGICPSGWHIPTDAEFDTLFNYVGGIKNAGTALKDTITWRGYYDNTNKYGFSMRAYDSYTDCEFRSVGYDANLWTTDNSDSTANDVYFSSTRTEATHGLARKQAYLQVRCLMDEKETPDEFSDFGSFEDSRDKQVYRTTKIGEDTWMADNLNYAVKAAEGTAHCYNDSASYCKTYGQLYTWGTATQDGTAQGICPDGWHVSTAEDWNALIETVNDNFYIGEKLKSTNLWKDIYYPENPYGFSAIPAGFMSEGDFIGIGTIAQFWLADATNESTAPYYEILYSNNIISKHTSDKKDERSVRCVKNR